ncbi:unnamed protein product [Arctogadus glacialis]
MKIHKHKVRAWLTRRGSRVPPLPPLSAMGRGGRGILRLGCGQGQEQSYNINAVFTLSLIQINNPDPHLVSEQANAMCIHEGFWGCGYRTSWSTVLPGVLMLCRPVHVSFKWSRPPYTVPVTVGQLLLDSDRLKSKRS